MCKAPETLAILPCVERSLIGGRKAFYYTAIIEDQEYSSIKAKVAAHLQETTGQLKPRQGGQSKVCTGAFLFGTNPGLPASCSGLR